MRSLQAEGGGHVPRIYLQIQLKYSQPHANVGPFPLCGGYMECMKMASDGARLSIIKRLDSMIGWRNFGSDLQGELE